MANQKQVKKAINWLISQGFFTSQKEIGEKMGIYNRSYLSQLVNSPNPNPDFINKFIEVAPVISKQYLLTGEGEMLKAEARSNAKTAGGAYQAEQQDDRVLMVDFVPIAASATFIDNLGNSTEPELDKFPVIPQGNEGAGADRLCVFEVEGDSMFPTIPSGALILAKEIPERSWHYAEGVVVAVYDQYLVVKRVARNALLTDNYLLLRSDNPDYGEMLVQLSDIRALYRAKRIISAPIR